MITAGTRVVYNGGDPEQEQAEPWLRKGSKGTVQNTGKYVRVKWDNTPKGGYLSMLASSVDRWTPPKPIGRPPEVAQDVAILEALGYRKSPGGEKYKNGALMSEEFRTFGPIGEPVRRVTLDYTGMHKYTCPYCGHVGLLSDKVTHGDYHRNRGDRIGQYMRISYR